MINMNNGKYALLIGILLIIKGSLDIFLHNWESFTFMQFINMLLSIVFLITGLIFVVIFFSEFKIVRKNKRR